MPFVYAHHPSLRNKKNHYHASRTVCAIPPSCDIPDIQAIHIMPRYFEIYTEIICDHEKKQKECMENMILPNMDDQQEIVRNFDTILKTYPIDDSSSLKYMILKLIIHQDEDTLSKLISLLNAYSVSVMMISEMIRDFNM